MQKVVISRAVKSLQIPSKTLCPFLYQTRTITQQRTRPSSLTSSEQPHRDEDNTQDTTLSFLQRKARDVEARRAAMESSITPSEREIFTNIMKNFGAKIDGFPPPSPSPSSETGQNAKAPLVKHDPMGVSSSQAGLASMHAKNTDINEILSLFAPAETNERFSAFSGSTETFSSDTDADTDDTTISTRPTPQNVRHAVLRSLQHISSSFKSALTSSTTPPDIALWQILESEIFPLITLMQTHRPSINVNPYQRPISSLPIEVLPNSISSLQPETPFLPLITILYPAATLLALRTYIAHFPTSGFIPALLPKIRSLGPASYLLAGNTHFFNVLMYVQWTVYSDLRNVHILLKEMDRTGVEHDQATVNLIEEISTQREQDIAEVDSRAQDWWRLKRQEEAWRRLMNTYRFDILKERREGKVDSEDQGLVTDQEIR